MLVCNMEVSVEKEKTSATTSWPLGGDARVDVYSIVYIRSSREKAKVKEKSLRIIYQAKIF